MADKTGSLSINSENIFPIIKKWLYSDHDIFYRELVSNGCDAITKLQKLEVMGEYTFPEGYRPRIDVAVSPANKTITVSDNGIGMSFDEVDEYINQIAFSGARDFLQKYKDKTNDDQIIGHFGLGFYSAFMVADQVEIETKSYRADCPAVHWVSEAGTEFAMTEGTRETPGTTITLHVNEDSVEFVNEYRAKEVLNKYCSFMPIEIYLTNADAPAPQETAPEEKEVEKEPEYDENGNEIIDAEDAAKEKEAKKGPAPINDIHPLWAKTPSECTEEEYKKFYRTVFNDYKEPLFWIHLNMDYPFRLKGILYFPKVNTEYDTIEGTIKLYNNQVFIADNIKEVIPEFLLLLKGVIDCPDLPLNVSRSALQNDGFVRKISDYITKKVADRLIGMYKTARADYEKYWDDIAPFLKYGYIRDEKFCERIKDYMLYKDLDGKYITLKDYLDAQAPAKEETPAEGENAAENAGDDTAKEASEDKKEEKEDKKEINVFYVSDEKAQSNYIAMFREQKMNALILTHTIDSAYISYVEQKNEGVHFVSVDSDLADAMKDSSEEDDTFKEWKEAIPGIFKEALNNDKLTVTLEKLKTADVAGVITKSEESRRMEEMMRRYSYGSSDRDMFSDMGMSLILNANHPLVKYICQNQTADNVSVFCEQIYDLALLNHGSLSPERMTAFMKRTSDLMLKLSAQE